MLFNILLTISLPIDTDNDKVLTVKPKLCGTWCKVGLTSAAVGGSIYIANKVLKRGKISKGDVKAISRLPSIPRGVVSGDPWPEILPHTEGFHKKYMYLLEEASRPAPLVNIASHPIVDEVAQTVVRKPSRLIDDKYAVEFDLVRAAGKVNKVVKIGKAIIAGIGAILLAKQIVQNHPEKPRISPPKSAFIEAQTGIAQNRQAADLGYNSQGISREEARDLGFDN